MDDTADIAAGLQRTLEHAFSSYREGRLADSAAQCREVLARLPDEPNALHLLGIVHLMNGEAVEAANTLAAAAQCQPDNAEIHNSLGAALRESGRLDDAEASYRRAIKLNPGASQGYFNLGNTLVDARRLADAENCYRTVLSVDPHHVGATIALGALAERTGDVDAAIEWYRQAILRGSTIAEPHRRLAALLAAGSDWTPALAHFETAIAIDPDDAPTHAEKGLTLARMERFDEAMEAFRRVLELEPDSPEALDNYASALCQCGEARASLVHFEKALRIDPANADAHANYANVLAALGRTDDAFTHYDQALALDPRHADAGSSKANTLKAIGRWNEALELFDTTLDIAPGHAGAHYGRSHVLLSLGRLAEGWNDYRWRPSMRNVDTTIRREPFDDDLAGRNILVVGDQGLGDELFFLRFVPTRRAADLSGRSANCPNDPTDEFIRACRRERPCDRQLRPRGLDRRPARAAGWRSRARHAAFIRDPCPRRPGPRHDQPSAGGRAAPYIGLTWRAGTTGVSGALSKDAPLADIARVVAGLEATVVVLQREPSDSELSHLAETIGRAPLDLSAFNVDLEDTLALVGLLDEYVAVSNTNVHLRAACGKTSRVLVPLPGEFRWMVDGQTTPWFEGTAVYREIAGDGWTPAFEALRRDMDDGSG